MRRIVLPLLGLLTLLLISFLGYRVYALSQELGASEQARVAEAEAARARESALAESLSAKTEEAIALAGELRTEQQKNGSFTRQIEELAGSVGTLTKLAQTDPELLAKYSKVYFLNENYAPERLSPIDPAFGLEEGRTYEFHASAAPELERLLKDAQDEGLSLRIASAYRSFASQRALKSGYTVRYGAGANAFSADQGYSEHQLGTAVDFSTPALGGAFASFEKTREYVWLTDNAWKYGFILSYPKGNTYYQYEPWHWRFVGKELANRLRDKDERFYDLDQRTIDQYLVSLFD